MGLQVASASVDGVVKIWNVKKQQCVNTFQMHTDKIWAMELHEKIEKVEERADAGDEESDEQADGFVSTIHMMTGGSDSIVKIWRDHTTEQEQEDKAEKLKRIQEEQKLSHLIREQDFEEAALLAFKLNRLRDFYHVLNKIVESKDGSLDQVDSVVQDMRRFEGLKNQDFKMPQARGQSQSLLVKIIDKLLKEDKAKFMKIIRNLNAKYEYSQVAQHLLAEVLPAFEHDEYLKDFETKEGSAVQDLRKVLEGTLIYQDRHYTRADRFLKTSYFIDHTINQMTLQEEKDQLITESKRAEAGELAFGDSLSKRQ